MFARLLMVFLIQATQNRNDAALHAKLDELIHATRGADELWLIVKRAIGATAKSTG